MPVYKSRAVFGIACGLNAFLNLEAGLIRGEVPDLERQLWHARARLEEQNRRLAQMRKQLNAGERKLQPPPRRSADGRREVGDPSGQPGGTARKEPGWHRRAIGGLWDEVG